VAYVSRGSIGEIVSIVISRLSVGRRISLMSEKKKSSHPEDCRCSKCLDDEPYLPVG
jgi:hypothetical protein